MNALGRLKRSAAALALGAAVVPLAIAAAPVAPAGAAQSRAANAAHTSTSLIQKVSYGRFRQLLQRQGDSAFLVGEGAHFTAHVRQVEAAAKAAGLKQVYWFAPSSAGATNWESVIDRDLKSLGGTVPAAGDAAEHVQLTRSDSYFFISYRPSGFAPTVGTKIISWINLSAQASANGTKADVTTAIQNDRNLLPQSNDALAHVSAHADASACSGSITNPAEHPYYVKVQIDGETYQDGCDTLPGYDDYSCTAIPDVQYDFADNQIFYYDDSGDLLAVAPWTEWQRISSYATWEAQQQAAAGSGSSGSGSSGSGSSGSSGSGSSGSGSTASTGSGATTGSGVTDSSTSVISSRTKVKRLAGTLTKKPSSKAKGKYKVTVTPPAGSKAAATGKVTVKVYKVGSKTTTVSGKLSKNTVTLTLPKLASGTWKVLISWPGNSTYAPDSVIATSIKVAK